MANFVKITSLILVFLLVCFLVYGFNLHQRCGKCDLAREDLQHLGEKLNSLEQEGLLTSKKSKKIDSSLIEKNISLLDPWGNPYYYSFVSSNNLECFAIWSFGSNGSQGGVAEHEKDLFLLSNCKKNKVSPTN